MSKGLPSPPAPLLPPHQGRIPHQLGEARGKSHFIYGTSTLVSFFSPTCVTTSNMILILSSQFPKDQGCNDHQGS